MLPKPQARYGDVNLKFTPRLKQTLSPKLRVSARIRDNIMQASVGLLAFFALLGSLTADPLWARNLEDLKGIWVVESPSPEGMIAQTVEFSNDDRELTGEWRYWPKWGPVKIKLDEVKLNGNDVSFRQKFDPCNGPPRGICRGLSWEGHFDTANRLTMTWMGEDGVFGSTGVPVRIRTFRRITPADLARIKADAPTNIITHRVALPALHEVSPNGLALTPPMGWNSWNFFKETVNDKEVREIADALVSSGLRDAGYVYLNIDDGWQGRRDKNGTLHPNSKFPDMRALADYLHSKGLKFGIYTVIGPISCAGYVGSLGYERQDARTFAEWGTDYLKYDWCSAEPFYSFEPDGRALFQKMGDALRATGRPIVYSLSGPAPVWGRKVGGNLWRTGGDSVEGDQWASVSARFDADGDPQAGGPGGWNDPDMMLIGLSGLTNEESRTHFTLWSMLSAPLLLGNDIRTMPAAVKDILLNAEVISIDQDPLGRQGRRILKDGSREVWVKPLADGSTAVALFNRGKESSRISGRWLALGLKGSQSARDLWRHVDSNKESRGYDNLVPPHGSVLLRVRASGKSRGS
jgi:alpha-galactosidase